MPDKIKETLTQTFSVLASYLPNFLSFLAGFTSAIFAEPIRQWLFKPVLSLEFKENPDCISKTIEAANGVKVTDAYYIKIKVTNNSRIIAKDCRAYLVNIEKQDENGKFAPTVYCDSIQLAWSCQGVEERRYRGMDICKGVKQFLDVITTRNTSSAFDPQIMVKPFRYLNLFKDRGVFRLTIQVSAAGTNPVIAKLIFKWNGIWDKFVMGQLWVGLVKIRMN